MLFIQFIAPPQQKPNIDNPVDNKNAAAKKDDASLTEEKKETTSEKPVGAVKEAASSDRPALSIRREL
ncbi:MAG: hypothetical protein LBU65_17400 [Planctomycetaceae bacterium]|nr:hypothetical protein [Planctomycetaceae bacterium]